MNIQNTRERLLASTMIGGAALLALAATPAMAQEQDQEATQVEQVVITGTRIAQANLVTTSPVTQVTGEDITNAGVSRVEDLVNQLPQIFAGQTSTVVNGSSGTATVDLRGLGPNRTVVLVDGRRMPYGSPAIAAADLNQIPSALVERVEVYTGGASAVYGADAVAGVVNFIMRKNFEGVRVDTQYGFYQHHNDYDGVGNIRAEIARRGAANPAEFQLPDDNVRDGESIQFSLIVGTDVGGGRGNITSYFTYRENNPVFQADRDYSACAVGAPAAGAPDTFTCGGSATSANGYFTDFETWDATVDPANPRGAFIPYDPNLHAYNYAPINYYMRPEERYSFGVFANYELNRAAEVYTQLMFTDSSTLAQIAGSGSFFNTESINCDNPFLMQTMANTDPAFLTMADIGCAAGGDTTFYVGRRNVEGGARVQDYNLNSYRLVGGLRGDVGDAWSYDLTAQYARVQYTDRYIGDFSVQRLGRALNVVDVGGTPTCQSVIDGTDPDCVPYNPFRPGGITQAQIDYLTLPLIATGYVTNQVLTAAMTGDLGVYGVQSPWASSGMQVAFGTEYRRDYLTVNTDSGYASGDGAGQGGAFIGISGATTARDYFAEMIFPIAEGLPFAESITLDAAYRHSKYNLADDTDTYKVGLDWAPTRDVRFRASYARAVRAPNVFNYFNAQNVVLFGRGGGDPCGAAMVSAGTGASLAQCTATGVPAANYGATFIDSPAAQYNQLTGGNPALNAEEADTYTYGVVFTPSFLPGFNMSIDYFDIEVSGAIGTFGASNTIDACYGVGAFSSPDPAACDRLSRAPGGQLWTNNGWVENLTINTGGVVTKGIDFVANYNMNLDDLGLAGMGGLSFNLTGTWLETLENTPFDGAPALECAGYYEGNCGFGSPEWRHRFTTSWNTPWNVNLLLTWRHHGEVEHFGLADTSTRIDRYFDSYNWIDIGATWQMFDNTRFRVGVNNVFDKDPPISYSQNGNGNTYPGVYDAMGRYIFFGVTADF